MANVKISALPATTSLTDNDEFPINQGGITKKTTLSQVISSVNNNNNNNSTGCGNGSLIVCVSGFDPNTAECDVTLVWDCNLKRFITTKTPKFVAPPAKSSIKFLGNAVGGYRAIMAVTYDDKIVYWGHDQNIIGVRNKNVVPQNYVRMKLLNNNGTTPTYEDYLSISQNKNVRITDLQYGKYGAMALLSDNTVWLNGNGPEIRGSCQITSPENLLNGYTRGYFLKVKNPNNDKYTKIAYGGDNNSGNYNCMLLTFDKNVYVFGSNIKGMCGAGVPAGTNVEITNGGSKISDPNIAGKAKDIFSSYSDGVSFILTETNELWGAGYNKYGVLGQNNINDKNIFVKISSDVKTFAKSPFTNVLSLFFIKTDGTIWGCGQNKYYQLNTGNTVDKLIPVQITNTSVGNFIKVDSTGWAGEGVSVIAMTDQGRVYTWGYNLYGTCGHGTNTTVTTPTLVINPITSQPLLAKDIYASRAYTSEGAFYIIGQDNMIYCAGYRAWTTATNNPNNANLESNRRFYPFSVNIDRDGISGFNVVAFDDHYGMFLTTVDGHLFYKGAQPEGVTFGSIITDSITEFSYVM
jgi:alpha-tubulin suppressor-like RCC1 family protein